MRVTIVGTGNMARAIARRALAGGHHVTFVGTVVNKADELVDEFRGEGPVAADETVGGDIVVLAVPYTQAPHVVRQHADRLDGMVVVDITNPVDLGARATGPRVHRAVRLGGTGHRRRRVRRCARRQGL